MPNLREHTDHRGRSTFRYSYDRLDQSGKRRVISAIEMMAEGSLSDVRHIANGVWERRIDSGPGYRVYYGWEEGDIVLLLTGTKDSQGNLNRGDIARALRLWSDRGEQRRN